MNYFDINSKEFIAKNHFPELPGIYMIIALDENQIPITISRFLDDDKFGILYIGQTKNLRKRLIKMKRAFSPDHKSEAHIAVRRYKTLIQMHKRFPIDRLVVKFELVTDNISSIQLEMLAFKNYEDIYGERPPLNRL
jgi:hypothetical protein